MKRQTKIPALSFPRAALLALCLCAAPTFAAETHTNSIGMEFVLIPAGTFQMGCSHEEDVSKEEDVCWAEDQMPRHEVHISQPFYLGKYEVTQAQWKAVMGNNPSDFKGANRPVDSISWDDAQEFIKKLNAKEGHDRYRLPTEAEWEYAARAGSATAYSFGDDKERLGKYAWYSENSGMKTHPVGRKLPNAWDLHDMHGNVKEWVQDWYGEYGTGPTVDPKGPGAGESRVHRGCCWINFAQICRSVFRHQLDPSYRSSCSGFRLALDMEP